MSTNNNISLVQLILSCVGTILSVSIIVIGSYISLKVDGAQRETRITALEKRIDKTDEKFDRIMDKLTELEVKISKAQ
jgi:cell division protein FtsL